MKEEVTPNFGLIIAFLIPGATALFGISYFVPTIHGWFGASTENAPSLGGFLYLTVAAFASGMTVTAIRWALIDSIHAFTGLRPPNLDFSRLHDRVEAFHLLIDIHYRHYQYYSNMYVATAIAYLCYRIKFNATLKVDWLDLGFVLLETVFFMTSRDTLRKYYQRTQQLLAEPPPRVSRRNKHAAI